MLNLYTAIKTWGLRGTLGGLVFIVTATLWYLNCLDATHDPGLNQGQRAMYQMMGEETLKRAGFYDIYPDGRPSDFVEFIESEEGQKLWPQTTDEYYSSHDPTRRPGSGPDRILQPSQITYTPFEVDPSAGKQVVYIPHDDLGKIEFRGYRDPQRGPFQTSKWPFPSDANPIDL